MNNKLNLTNILAWTIAGLALCLVISFIAGFLAMLWGYILIGFGIALGILVVKKIQGKPIVDHFILIWGFVISAILIAIYFVAIILMRYFIIAIVIGLLIWAIIARSKKS